MKNRSNLNSQLHKDKSIVNLLDGLTELLGAEGFDVVDHWEGDMLATGIAHPANHSVLVYISTIGKTGQRCSISLELPPQPGSELPYTPVGDRDVETLDELAEIIRRHFEHARAT